MMFSKYFNRIRGYFLNRCEIFLRILKYIKIMNLLNIRYGYSNFREIVSRYRVKSRQKRANFVNYWNRQR